MKIWIFRKGKILVFHQYLDNKLCVTTDTEKRWATYEDQGNNIRRAGPYGDFYEEIHGSFAMEI